MKIEARELTKIYGETVALDNVSLTLDEAKIYGLLGRNGAGKTTLLNLLTAKTHPTKGSIIIDGEPVWENDKVLGNIFYMSEQNLYPASLRVWQVFKWTAEFYPGFDLLYAEELARRFELNTKKRVKGLSTGYASIFKAILALASGAKILLFDEPVLGLDANHRELLYREIVAHYSEHPKTIILSTHLIEEIADLLEDVIIIQKGQIILKQSVEELLASAHTVSGAASGVDQYIQGKQCIATEQLQNFKSATILGGALDQTLAKSLELELGKPELQKLFIGLTNS
ncbi:MAG: ABC transporter ATP-binding protein [Limnochordia bacterium]|nr:ABC transporter ATP-binding protein [Limnochordia bacterium]